VTRYLLDTHVWIWAQRGDTAQISSAMQVEMLEWQRNGAMFLSPISVWEAALLVASGLLELGLSMDQFVEQAANDGGLNLAPLTSQVLIESTRLPGELHRDPADRILVATAREHAFTLVTRDKLLLRYARQGYLNALKP